MHVLWSVERMMKSLEVAWTHCLICIVASSKCGWENEVETTKHSHQGSRPGWRTDVQVIELPNLASYTQAHTGLTVPGKGLRGGKEAGWASPGSWIGWLDHRVILVTPLGPLSKSNHSRIKPVTKEVSAHLGPMPPHEGLLSSLIQMLISKVDPASHLPAFRVPLRPWSPPV